MESPHSSEGGELELFAAFDESRIPKRKYSDIFKH
jgi:hypothetical protein